MIDTTDFFQKEAEECKRLAAKAIRKNDKEYWLGLAERWERLPQLRDDTDLSTVRSLRPVRAIYSKRPKRAA